MKLNHLKPQSLRLLLALVAIATACTFGFTTEPLTAADIAKMGKPAKVTWSPSRITEADFVDGMAVLSFTSNQDVAEVSIQATPSLTPYLTVEPSSYSEVMAGDDYEVIVTLNDPDEPVGHTLGGTIKVKEGSRTLAKPLSVSIKSDATEEEDPEGDEDDDEGDPEGEDDDDDGEEINTLTWDPEIIDESLFSEGEVVEIIFISTRELEKVCLWVTPSAQGFLTVEPMMISPVLADEPNLLMLTLSVPLADLPKDEVGGTLHVRQCDESGKMRRTYDPPIGIEIIPGEGEEPPEADPEILVSSADLDGGPVSPNEIVSVFGQGLGPDDSKALNAKGASIDTILDNTQVLFNGTAAPVLYSDDNQVNAIVPSNVAGQSDVVMRVLYEGKVSAPYVVAVTDASPALYALDGSGSGQGAILNSDLTLNSRSNRAAPGSWVVLYGTGGGLGETGAEDGEILTDSIPLALPVEVTVNGVPAHVLWAGYPAGSVLGLIQVNVELPVDPRVIFGDWPVVLKIGDKESGDDITVAIE